MFYEIAFDSTFSGALSAGSERIVRNKMLAQEILLRSRPPLALDTADLLFSRNANFITFSMYFES